MSDMEQKQKALDLFMREQTANTQEAVALLLHQAVGYAVLTKYEDATWQELKSELMDHFSVAIDVGSATAQTMGGSV